MQMASSSAWRVRMIQAFLWYPSSTVSWLSQHATAMEEEKGETCWMEWWRSSGALTDPKYGSPGVALGCNVCHSPRISLAGVVRLAQMKATELNTECTSLHLNTNGTKVCPSCLVVLPYLICHAGTKDCKDYGERQSRRSAKKSSNRWYCIHFACLKYPFCFPPAEVERTKEMTEVLRKSLFQSLGMQYCSKCKVCFICAW